MSRKRVVSDILEQQSTSEYAASLERTQKVNLDRLSALMCAERARPSLLGPASGPVLGLLFCACDLVGREGDRETMVAAIEKGLQDEMDEQLRILNEKDIKDKDLRNLIIAVRDESYEAVASQGKDEASTERDQKTPLHSVMANATLAVMRLSRSL